MNSRSSLHNEPVEGNSKEEVKLRKAIYNPISIKGSYKRYFKNKFEE
jgi:hypothetical protein